ncbi:MAG: hypothetical protein B5766_12030 [Candidatus Lumbricidophila eiseniae]|uniref:HTH deoR-type domain-containing protein n=1 Tax=Candidatus Lumbricidiphila eiseniae TaxID=1969409 RepID=A0A2A6FN98_9MICO|nr:MAG: hypothetical protein B5766_12030 [Candidatus Lumbricidophila eiseniae]
MIVEESYRHVSAPERRQRLERFISDQGYCTITELSRELGVSEMTIRRDVLRLVEQGRVRGFRGGVASLSRQDLAGSDYRFRDVKMGDAKRAIAQKAIDMLGLNSIIAVDAGTTTNQFARMLPTDRSIKIVTHSFPVVSSLVGNEGVEVICLGGTLHPESLSFDGPATLAAISGLQVEILFLAASGLGERGAFCGNGFDAITKRALIEVAERVVLLADSTKFFSPAMVKICDWDAIDRIIIDEEITEDQERMLEQNDIEIVKVTHTSAPVGNTDTDAAP